MKAMVVGGGIGGLTAAASIMPRSRLVGRWFYQLENPVACALRDAAFKSVLARGQLGQLDPVLGYEA